MGWKQAYLKRVSLKLRIFGAAAGMWAAFLAEATLLYAESSQLEWLRYYGPIVVLGVTFGALFAPIDEMAYRFWNRAGKAAMAGALLSGVGGLVSFALVSYFLAPVADEPGIPGTAALTPFRWLWFFIPFSLLAANAGLASGWVLGDTKKAFRRAGWGFVAGGAAGVPLAAVYLFAWENPAVHLLAFAAWSGFVSWVIFWGEKRMAKNWLRVLIGPEEDRIYPMEKHRITVGKLESNDIPLPDSQEIYPFHCEIHWAGDHYEIIDDENGGVVLVNFRQIQEQPLKNGDLVKIGSVLLQYGGGAQP